MNFDVAKDSVDDGILESLADKVHRSSELLGVPEAIDQVKEHVEEGSQQVHNFITAWGEEVVKVLSEAL